MDPEAELLRRVADRAQRKEFFESVLLRDAFDDWTLAKDFGEFMIRQDPEEIMGHAIVARASRHLGHLEKAREELAECRKRDPHPSEIELFLSFFAEEEGLIANSG